MKPPAYVLVFAMALAASHAQAGGPFGLPEFSAASRSCIECHKKEDPGLYQQWGASRHYTAKIGCFECHSAERGSPGAFLHHDHYISTIVSPRMCARCHTKEVEEFGASLHAKAGRIAGSDMHLLAEVVAGSPTMRTPGFHAGVSATFVAGCASCHGSTVRMLPGGRLDPATWPNYGIGRINPDGSEGACSSCHSPHTFSAKDARQPETCAKCHVGHDSKDIFGTSGHGAAFHASADHMNMHLPKWIVGEDYAAAPNCATCHMSATPNQPVTHNVGTRLSWNNRPDVSVRPEAVEANLDMPGARVSWQERRRNMQDVCLNCHSRDWVDSFYVQYDGLVTLYHDKFARPSRDLYALAAPLRHPVRFANKIDFTWHEMWSEHGRRARQAASMASAHHVHESMLELARSFYTEFIPQIEELIVRGLQSGEREQIAAAEALRARLDAVMNSEYHRWRLRAEPEEAARRARQREEFRSRYPQ
jgi:hydroxylamine dehydrogenase